MSDTETRAWWTTSIIDMEPGRIAFRGEKIEDLIGNSSFAEMIWFMVVGTKPSPGQTALLDAALVAGVDHGPQAPSIAAAVIPTPANSSRKPGARVARRDAHVRRAAVVRWWSGGVADVGSGGRS